MIFPITFCSWVYAIQSSDQHTFQKTFCIVVVIDWIWLDQVLTLYWQRVKTNYRLGTGSEFNYRLSSGSGFNYKLCIGSGGCEYSSGCKLQIVLGQVWRSHKMQLIFYGCFNFLNIYTTTKCKWDLMLDASTNSRYTTTKIDKIQMRMLNETTTKWMQLQNCWPNSTFLYKTTPGWQSVL